MPEREKAIDPDFLARQQAAKRKPKTLDFFVPGSIRYEFADKRSNARSMNGPTLLNHLQLAQQHGWKPAGTVCLSLPQAQLQPDGTITTERPEGSFIEGERINGLSGYFAGRRRMSQEDAYALGTAMKAVPPETDVYAAPLSAWLLAAGPLGIDIS